MGIRSILVLFSFLIASQVWSFDIPPLYKVIPLEKRQFIEQWKKQHQHVQKSIAHLKNKLRNQTVDLRYRDTKVKEQWNGTCTAFGLIAGIENLIGNKDQAHLSERHLWSLYEEYDSDVAMKTALNNYITEEDYWPQDNKRPYVGYKEKAHSKLLKSTYIGTDVEAAILALQERKPVYLAITVTEDMMNCEEKIGAYSGTTDGGHAVSIVGYKMDENMTGGGYFILKNSWGVYCGDGGYQYLSFHQCFRDDMYCSMYTLDAVESHFKLKK